MAPQSVEENSKLSDRERGTRIIPIVFEKKTAAIPVAVVTEIKGHQGFIDDTSNKTVIGSDFNTSVHHGARETSQTTDLSSKKGFSSDCRSSSMTDNVSSNRKTENGVRSLTADVKDIKTDMEREKKAENRAGSLTVHSENSFGIENGSKKVENDKEIPLQSSDDIRVADNLSGDRIIKDGKNSVSVGEDSNGTGNLFTDLSQKKTSVVTNSSSFDKRENGFSTFGNENDVSKTQTVICDKKSDSNVENFSSEQANNGSTLKTFSQSKKSFSDFSLSTQLGQPIREFFSCRNQAGQTTRCWGDSGSSLTTQTPPSTDVGKSAIKSDRARFFMDMVREDDGSVGSSPPLLDLVRGRGLVEVRPPASPAGSTTTTSRGRSSSSAIMSRFAPQPYGRSKSVDSASLRVPMLSVHGAMRREQSPEVMMGMEESKTVSSCTITPSSSEPNPPSFSSLTSLRLQAVTLSPAQTMATTKATEDKQEVAAVSWIHVPDKVLTHSKTENASSQLSSGNLSVFDRPSYGIPTISSSVLSSEKRIISAESLEKKSVPNTRHMLSNAAALGRTAGDSESTVTKAVTSVVRGTTLSPIDPSVDLGQMGPKAALAKNVATGSNSPPASCHLVVTAISGIVPTATTVSCSVTTQVSTPLLDLKFSKSTLAAGSDTVAVVSCTKPLASVILSPSLSSKASMSSDPKISPLTTMPVSARILKGDSLSSESSAGGFGTVSDTKTKSTSPEVTVSADSESRTGHTSVGTISKSPPSLSKAEDLQCAEEMADTPWDSNVKRLAHIFAVTIGGTVKNKVNFRSGRNKASDHASGTDNRMEVAPSRIEHAKKEMADGKSSTIPSPHVSASIGELGRSLPSASRGAATSCVHHQQAAVDSSYSMDCSPSPLSPDITQTPYYKVNSLDQSKIDTSADSVSTALSVLLQNNSFGHNSPVRPSRLRTTISSAYRRKLGSGALDNYSQNMTALYGDCTPKKDDIASSEVQDSSAESVVSPPLLEAPLIEDLPRILALDTLDGMPFYPRIGSHMNCRESEISGEEMDGKVNDQLDNYNESLKIGDVELTVIANPVQVADLVQLDSAETVAPSTSASFSPSDELVPSYIDDPVTSDKDRFISETAARPLSRRKFRKDGKPERRVTFDPVSLLLNAALEGEKDLVIDVVNKVSALPWLPSLQFSVARSLE